MNNIIDFDTLTDIFQQRYDLFRGGLEIRKHDDYIERYQISKNTIIALEPVINDCLNLTKGRPTSTSPVNSKVSKLVCPFPPLLKISSIDQVQPPVREELSGVIDQTFQLGLLSYIILCNNHARMQIDDIDKSQLFTRWADEAAVADLEFKKFDRESGGIFEGVFNTHYDEKILPVVNNKLKVNFLKKGRFKSRFRLIYYSGCILCMLSDIAASEI